MLPLGNWSEQRRELSAQGATQSQCKLWVSTASNVRRGQRSVLVQTKLILWACGSHQRCNRRRCRHASRPSSINTRQIHAGFLRTSAVPDPEQQLNNVAHPAQGPKGRFPYESRALWGRFPYEARALWSSVGPDLTPNTHPFVFDRGHRDQEEGLRNTTEGVVKTWASIGKLASLDAAFDHKLVYTFPPKEARAPHRRRR